MKKKLTQVYVLEDDLTKQTRGKFLYYDDGTIERRGDHSEIEKCSIKEASPKLLNKLRKTKK